MTPDERAKQIRLASERLEFLDAVVTAQERHSEVSAVIAAADDKAAAIEAISALLDVGAMPARAVSDLPWRRLAGDSRRQALEDRNEIIAELRELEA